MAIIKYCPAYHVYCTQSVGVPGPGCSREHSRVCAERWREISRQNRKQLNEAFGVPARLIMGTETIEFRR